MRRIETEKIISAVRDLVIEASTDLGEDVIDALKSAKDLEVSEYGIEILNGLIENAKIAKKDKIPLCQDTGMAVFFIEMGQNVNIVGGSLNDAINEGVRRGYEDGYLRKSVCDAITRKNTLDNTPAVIHLDLVEGEKFKISLLMKGFGAENMSGVSMLPPSAGLDGVRDFVIKKVEEAGANPCPPTIVCVGIGGTMEMASLLAKKAMLRPLGSINSNKILKQLESDWLQCINRLGIGPQGLGGRMTALSVHIETMPTHIASIPVAVNLQCHASRHKTIQL